MTVGNYDGIHRGQRSVLDRVSARARLLGLPAVVVTFEPHPLAILAPDQAPATLLTRDQKCRLLGAAGIDLMALIPFTAAFAATRAENFVRDFLFGRLGVRELYVGQHFAFGQESRGQPRAPLPAGEELGFGVFGLEEERAGGDPISSTRIRRALALGGWSRPPVSSAGRTVDRPDREGDRMGRRLGWPTVNLRPEATPSASTGFTPLGSHFRELSTGRSFDSVTNVGRRPTVSADLPRSSRATFSTSTATSTGRGWSSSSTGGCGMSALPVGDGPFGPDPAGCLGEPRILRDSQAF